VEKYIIRNKYGFSTASTNCGQLYSIGLDKLSTSYPQTVDEQVMHNRLFRVKTQ